MKNINYSLRHRKQYGLHFLKNNFIARRIVESGNISDDDVVLEIGPGKGILTKLLLEKGATVIAIEKDRNLYDIINKRFKSSIERGKLVLINDDALRVSLDNIKFNKIVSNIPYSISSALTLKILRSKFEKGIVMYQKEFAERIANVPPRKKYNRLATTIYFLAEIRILFYVSPRAFSPPPKVYSAVVEIIPKNLEVPQKLEEFIKILFSRPRKKIKNVINNCLDYGEKRAEDLTPIEVMKLFEANSNNF